ncbi:hypothetical protein [Nostoc sp.]|uniref:hypothetical protein n=1 Tax=Nostoc sp. TaxID=1180 RepID=UPI002FFA25BF
MKPDVIVFKVTVKSPIFIFYPNKKFLEYRINTNLKYLNFRSFMNISSLVKSLSLATLGAAFSVLGTALWVKPASAISFQGRPTPDLDPVFGTLVNFDDKPAGLVNFDDYVSFGIASITGTNQLQRYGFGSQSPPNYVGNSVFNGSILI